MKRYSNRGRHCAAGFTLIELMITIAIVSILASLAIPAYFEHVAKGRRNEAMVALMEGAQALERYYSANGTYLQDGALAEVFPEQAPATGVAHYNLAQQAAGANSFTLRATRAGAMADDECGNIEITQSGRLALDDNTRSEAECLRR